MFRVGQKVARVSGKPRDDEDFALPPLGVSCTVVKSYVVGNCIAMIELAEFCRPGTSVFYAGFLACRFRPIVERKTDISVFTAMLDRTSAPFEVEA